MVRLFAENCKENMEMEDLKHYNLIRVLNSTVNGRIKEPDVR